MDTHYSELKRSGGPFPTFRHQLCSIRKLDGDSSGSADTVERCTGRVIFASPFLDPCKFFSRSALVALVIALFHFLQRSIKDMAGYWVSICP